MPVTQASVQTSGGDSKIQSQHHDVVLFIKMMTSMPVNPAETKYIYVRGRHQ